MSFFINCFIAAGIVSITGYLLIMWKRPNGVLLNGSDHSYYPPATITDEFDLLSGLIEGAATRTELACLEDRIDDFEASHKSHAWVDEMYKDLLSELQQKYNLLSAKERLVKA